MRQHVCTADRHHTTPHWQHRSSRSRFRNNSTEFDTTNLTPALKLIDINDYPCYHLMLKTAFGQMKSIKIENMNGWYYLTYKERSSGNNGLDSLSYRIEIPYITLFIQYRLLHVILLTKGNRLTNAIFGEIECKMYSE